MFEQTYLKKIRNELIDKKGNIYESLNTIWNKKKPYQLLKEQIFFFNFFKILG